MSTKNSLQDIKSVAIFDFQNVLFKIVQRKQNGYCDPHSMENMRYNVFWERSDKRSQNTRTHPICQNATTHASTTRMWRVGGPYYLRSVTDRKTLRRYCTFTFIPFYFYPVQILNKQIWIQSWIYVLCNQQPMDN